MDAATEDGGEDHLDVFGEGIVVEVVEIEADLCQLQYAVNGFIKCILNLTFPTKFTFLIVFSLPYLEEDLEEGLSCRLPICGRSCCRRCRCLTSKDGNPRCRGRNRGGHIS